MLKNPFFSWTTKEIFFAVSANSFFILLISVAASALASATTFSGSFLNLSIITSDAFLFALSCASAFFALLISYLKNSPQLYFLVCFFLPLLYIGAFLNISFIYFHPNFYQYFLVFHHLAFIFLVINLLCLWFFYWLFTRNQQLKQIVTFYHLP